MTPSAFSYVRSQSSTEYRVTAVPGDCFWAVTEQRFTFFLCIPVDIQHIECPCIFFIHSDSERERQPLCRERKHDTAGAAFIERCAGTAETVWSTESVLKQIRIGAFFTRSCDQQIGPTLLQCPVVLGSLSLSDAPSGAETLYKFMTATHIAYNRV